MTDLVSADAGQRSAFSWTLGATLDFLDRVHSMSNHATTVLSHRLQWCVSDAAARVKGTGGEGRTRRTVSMALHCGCAASCDCIVHHSKTGAPKHTHIVMKDSCSPAEGHWSV